MPPQEKTHASQKNQHEEALKKKAGASSLDPTSILPQDNWGRKPESYARPLLGEDARIAPPFAALGRGGQSQKRLARSQKRLARGGAVVCAPRGRLELKQ